MSAAKTYDRTIEDIGNVVALEHVNTRVPDQQLATLFYVDGSRPDARSLSDDRRDQHVDQRRHAASFICRPASRRWCAGTRGS